MKEKKKPKQQRPRQVQEPEDTQPIQKQTGKGSIPVAGKQAPQTSGKAGSSQVVNNPQRGMPRNGLNKRGK
ncbi:MAG: hypothetical protein ACOC5K_00935 [Chloroflexota bacterium]